MKVVTKANKKILTIAIPLFIIVCMITFITCMTLTPTLELTDNVITLPIGTTFEEPGYKAYYNNKDISGEVIVKGSVNSNKIGTYILTYEVKKLFLSTKKIRFIEVVDNQAPSLELVGTNEVFLCPKNTYQEEGYQAIDNYDQNITSKVKLKEKDNTIYYEVTDSSGNKTIKERKIYYQDKESPQITLTGRKIEYIYLNSKYTEPGYQAIDNCDGNITNQVKVTNSVNTNILGTYEISYQVADSSGNVTTINRTIHVIARPTNDDGTIYLTFDDGPSQTITGPILDILKEEGIPATFFVINHSNDLNYLIKRAYDEGHTIGLHSYNHDYKNIYQSKDNYFKDLEKIKNKVKNITGETSNIIRFPGGSSNTISKKYKQGIMSELTKEVVDKGYHYFDWNVSSGDAGGVSSSDDVYQNVITGLSPNQNNVVLMHDFENNYYTLNALRAIIKYGKINGYTFKKITMDTSMVTHRVAN